MTTPSLPGQTPKQLPRARARFLAQAIQLEEEGVSNIIKTAIYFSLFLVIAIIIWASFTTVNEMTTAEGEVVPTGYIHDIQHLEGGIISEIAVRNGDAVQKGDLLIRFAQPVSLADYDQLMVRKAALLLTQERLMAIKQNRAPDFGELAIQYPDLASKELTNYYSQLKSSNSEIDVLKAQSRQRQSELRKQKNEVVSLKNEIALLEKQVEMREKLAAKHIVSQTDLLATRSQLASVQSQLKSVIDGINVASLAFDETISHRKEIIDTRNKEIDFEVSEIASQLAEVEKSLTKAKDRVKRLDLYSPINGIIQGISVNSINTVVQAGSVIMQVVPVDGNLIVEARILPKDIGHIHIDQTTEVKVDSYDTSKFGHIDGVVQQLSPSTYLDEEMNPYYLARIGLNKNYVGDDPKKMKVIPGMTVQVNIITGSKSIMDYLLKPINRGFKNAFQER